MDKEAEKLNKESDRASKLDTDVAVEGPHKDAGQVSLSHASHAASPPDEDDKKRASSAGSPEVSPDDLTPLPPPVPQLKANIERVKENQLRQKLLYGEPKCNIEKESKLLAQPGSIGREMGHDLPPAPQGFTPIPTNIPSNMSPINPTNISISSPNNSFPIHHAYSVLMAVNTNPPLITHTAATPQGSPYATLENVGGGTRDMNSLNLGKNIYNQAADQENRHKAVSRSASGGNSCGVSGSASLRRRESLSPNDLPGRREDLAHLVKPGRARSSSGGGSPSLWQRRGSQKKHLSCNNSNNFYNKRNSGDCESLVDDDSGESDTEPQMAMALNNNRTINNNLNNHQAPSRGSTSQSWHPSIQGHVSTCGSVRELEYKPNNLELTKDDAALTITEDGDTVEEENPLPKKILFIFEPKGCFKDRMDYSLYMFDMDHPIRCFCMWLISQKWFDSTILFFIALNCITLAMERPNIPPNSAERWFLWILNYVFTFVFAFEMFFKVLAKGLYLGKGTYFTSGWNKMDGTLVTISIVDFLMSLMENSSPRIFGILRVFRLLRALRPLRVINRAPGLKLVVMTLLSSLQPIGNIVLICCTFFIIFGILGVQLFKGTFFYCDGSDVSMIRTKADCLEAGYTWLNRKYNFDALPQALMALFVLSSKDGWVNIMYTGLDAVGVDIQPVENYSQWRLLYFISFLLLVGFFVLNMFVGVVVENFHRCREEQEKEEKARRAEKRAKKLEKKRRKMREPPYYATYSKFRLFIHNLVTSKYFDLAIAAVIGLNVITMACEFYKMPKELEYALQIFNYFFTAVFILESMMKILALGCNRYFRDSEEYRWNQLDVAIVILSVIGIGLEEVQSDFIPINPTIIRVMRVLRIARVLKLLKMAKGIRALLDTVMQALPQVGNLGLLFFLLFFIFAALGVELFGRLECDELFPCQGLGEHAHFKNFGMAFLTLFRVATGDNWNGIMKDTLRTQCDPEPECVKNCCLYPFVAPIFFVVFVLMAQFVLVNVVVAVLMKHLEESHKLEEEEAEFNALLAMEDEYDLEVEIERQLAKEEEEMVEMQENLTNQKLAEQAAKAIQKLLQHNRKDICDSSHSKYFHKPLGKMSSLPSNFTFRGSDCSDDKFTPPVSIVASEPAYTIPSININGMGYDTAIEGSSSNIPHCNISADLYSPNLKRASQDDTDNKVSMTDLRQLSQVITTADARYKGGARPRNTAISKKNEAGVSQGKSNKDFSLNDEGKTVVNRKGNRSQSLVTSLLSDRESRTFCSLNKEKDTLFEKRLLQEKDNLCFDSIAKNSSKNDFEHEQNQKNYSDMKNESDIESNIIICNRKDSISSDLGSDNDRQKLVYDWREEGRREGDFREGDCIELDWQTEERINKEGQNRIEKVSCLSQEQNSSCVKINSSPISQRAWRQSLWTGRKANSNSTFRKVSLDDSFSASLMTSFDVPELGGRIDMDSTSCSVCSSDEVSSLHSRPSNPSPLCIASNSGPSGFSTSRETTQIQSPLPAKEPKEILTGTFYSDDVDEDPTFNSSSDSFTLEGVPDFPSPDSSSMSEVVSGLAAPISSLHHQRSFSPYVALQVEDDSLSEQQNVQLAPKTRKQSSSSSLSSSLQSSKKIHSQRSPEINLSSNFVHHEILPSSPLSLKRELCASDIVPGNLALTQHLSHVSNQSLPNMSITKHQISSLPVTESNPLSHSQELVSNITQTFSNSYAEHQTSVPVNDSNTKTDTNLPLALSLPTNTVITSISCLESRPLTTNEQQSLLQSLPHDHCDSEKNSSRKSES